MSEIQYWIKTSEYLALEEPLMMALMLDLLIVLKRFKKQRKL